MSTPKKLYVLSRVIFPDADFSNNTELFFHTTHSYRDFDSMNIVKSTIFSFDTWMNIFASEKWYHYCDLNLLYLVMKISGNFYIQIIGHHVTPAFGTVNTVIFSQFYTMKKIETISIPISDAQSYTGISFSIEFADTNQYPIKEIAWCTNVAPQRQNKLAVVCCTYKREKYVLKTIKKFFAFMQNNKTLMNRLHLFVVDNGQTLSKNLQNEYVDILPNINAGGAGGFTRGLMEANDRGFTRCLFMDDDVEIFPETFFRTLILTDYFKNDYKDYFINGPMMNLNNKTELFENLAVYNDNLWVDAYRSAIPVDSVDNIFKSIHVDPKIFQDSSKWIDAAWWYSCFSLALFKDEYPFPCFFRGDDVEWAWRKHGVPHVSLNGICVWHVPFIWRVSKYADFYYLVRNMFFITSIYIDNYKERLFNILQDKFNYCLLTLDYVSVEFVLTAVTDLLKGYKIFQENPEKQLERLKFIMKKAKYIKEDDQDFLQYLKTANLYQLNKPYGVALDWYPPIDLFLNKQEVRVYNLAKGVYELRIRDETKEIQLRNNFTALYHLLLTQYDDLIKNFRIGHQIFKTRTFWNEYLSVHSEHNQNTPT